MSSNWCSLERAFFNAIENGDVENFIRCINQGIAINPPCRKMYGLKALVRACSCGKIDIVRCLTKQYNVNAEIQEQAGWAETRESNLRTPIYTILPFEVSGLNAIHIASKFGHLDIVDYFINECNVDINVRNPRHYWTPLSFAVYYNRLNVVQYLVNHGSLNINLQTDIELGTVLHLASGVKIGCEFLGTVSRLDSDVQIAQCLVDQGKIDINRQDRVGRTALHRACSAGKSDMVTFLTNQTNINVHIQDNYGGTALSNAVKVGCLETVQDLVVRCHSNMNLQCTCGYTALHLAIQFHHVHIASWLIDQGADVTIKCYAGSNIFDFALQSHFHNGFVVLFLEKLLHTHK